MKIIDIILSSKHFADKPPVLIDIGASGEINAKWKRLAPYAICLAFDADDREFSASEDTKSGYRKLIVVNRIVTATEQASTDFYLTAFPFCSSLLEPANERLQPWAYQSLFKVDRKVKLQSITIQQALHQAGLMYIDWFKTDSQGTDLRLYLSIAEEMRRNIMAAEFEPGIIDAYQGEDKLFSIMQEMDQSGFWLSSMNVMGAQRLHERYLASFGNFQGKRMVRNSPCWAEVTYLHQAGLSDVRQLLLLFVFALLERQYGFALEICDSAMTADRDPLFPMCKEAVLKQLGKEKMKLPLVLMKKRFNRLFADINA